MWKHVFMSLALSLGLAGSAAASDPINVLVTTLPQKELVEHIGGDQVNVTVMVPQGADPHSYEPKPSQLVAASKAKVWFTVGMPLEQSQGESIKAVSPDLEMVPVASKVELIPMKTALEIEDEAEHVHFHPGSSIPCTEDHDHDHHHHHGPGCCHHHHDGEPDPHVWLSVKSAVLEAQVIRDTLSRLAPAQKEYFENNYQDFEVFAQKLDAKLADILKDARGKAFMTFHPAWGYFARDYDLIQLPIEIEGREPGQKTLIKVIDFAREQGVKAILVEPQFSTKGASVIAQELGIPMVTVDPLSPNWEEGLTQAAEAIAQGVR